MIARATEPVPRCPACNGDGVVTTNNAQDYITGTSGRWIFRRCRRCRSLWQDPCTVAEDIGKLYPENYLFTRDPVAAPDAKAPGFKASLKIQLLEKLYRYPSAATDRFGFARILGMLPSIRARIGRNVRYLPRVENGRLLDVGCGNGVFLQQMQELGWQAEGIEPDPEAAKIAVSRGFRVMSDTLEHADLPKEQYDAITATHVMEHFRQPQFALERIASSLKRGGTFVSISPNPVGLLSKLFQDKWYELDAPRHLVIPSPEGYRIMCRKVGLRPICWSTHLITFWIFRESVSIRRTGKTGQCSARIGPKLFSTLSSWLLPFFPESGEEVVCYAIKD